MQYNNNTFTNCNSTTSTTSLAPVTLTSSITVATSASLVTSTPSSSPSSSQSNTDSVVGGVVGGIAGLALIIGAGFVCWRRRNRHQPLPTTDQNTAMVSAITPYLGRHASHLIHVRVTHSIALYFQIIPISPLTSLNRPDPDWLTRIPLRTLCYAQMGELHTLRRTGRMSCCLILQSSRLGTRTWDPCQRCIVRGPGDSLRHTTPNGNHRLALIPVRYLNQWPRTPRHLSRSPNHS